MNWIEEIKRLGIDPPDSNNIVIRVQLPPVSRQSNGYARREFIESVRERCASFSYLISGDVKIDILWRVHEQERYETDRTPDVDNIIKPLLDALSGPKGIIIDDNQVQCVTCSWIDWLHRTEEIVVEVAFESEDWMPKGHFFFVQFDRGLCFPIASYFPRNLQDALVRIFEKSLESRFDLEAQGVGYETSRRLMPVARVFHRTRIGEFPVLTLEEFRRREREPYLT